MSINKIVCCQVTARWLLDLEEYNEWMNEEDYIAEEEVGDAILAVLDVTTERLKWRLLLRQMRESAKCQTLHMRVASHARKIQSSGPNDDVQYDVT